MGAYALIGGYSAGLVGLFMPLCIIVGMVFADDNPLLILFLAGIAGAIVWVPLSVVVAIVLGVGGVVLGLAVGVVAAVLFRLARRDAATLSGLRVLVALLNAAVFGLAIGWLYSHTFHRIFSEFTALPTLFGVCGALAGLVMGLISPEKLQDAEPVSDEESEAAMKVVTAPFRLWRGVAGRATSGSAGFWEETLGSNKDPNGLQFSSKELERLQKESERQRREMEKQQKEMEERMKRIQRGDFR